MQAPQNKFGFSSNCNICWDQALDTLSMELGVILLAISLISSAAGFLANRKQRILPLLVMLSLGLIYLANFKTGVEYHFGMNLSQIQHQINTNRSHAEVDSKALADRVRHQAAERAIKGWAAFSLLPFTIGFAAGRFRRP